MASPVASVWAKLRLDMTDFASNLAKASKDVNKFGAAQSKALKNHPGFTEAATAVRTFNRSLSDTINITRGIVISQTFYAIVGAVREAADALWEFNKQLDYAHVTYTALFGDATLAKDFMSVLQEHSIETIFDYQDLANMSKKLLAYGIEYENLMFIMEGLTNLGAMSGDTAALDRISLALGQIYAKGKLSAEEMRQLANAYVPISEIIQEQFGLTEDQMGRVGDLNLPAEDVINAIVDYANKNFGGVGDAAMYTITGLQAKIVDTLKVVGAEMLGPVTDAYKAFLAYVAGGLQTLREQFSVGGFGAIFEYLVPDEGTQDTIRIFFANIHNMLMSIAAVAKTAGQVIGNFGVVFVHAFNAAAPVITGMTNALAAALSAILDTRAGTIALRVALLAAAVGFAAMKIQAVGALVITVLTKAVTGLSKALLALGVIIAKHPIFALLSLLGVTLVGVSASSERASGALSGLFDTLAGTGGTSSSDILQNTKKDIGSAEDAINRFNKRLGAGTEEAEDLADGIGGVNDAAKKAKKTGDLLSFDEVFRLNDKTAASAGSGVGSGAAGALEDIEGLMAGLDSLGGSLLPDIGNFADYLSSFSEDMYGAFNNATSLLPTITGFFAGIAQVLSKAWGGSFKNVLSLLKASSFSGFFKNFADLFKAAGLKSVLKGGIIGAAVGLIADTFATMLWGTLAENLNLSAEATGNAAVGQTIGSVIGTIVGGIFGGPVGALIGSVLGTFAGGFVGLFWEKIEEYFDPDNNVLSAFIVGTATELADWWIGTKDGFTDWWQSTTTGFSSWWNDTWSGFSTWWDDTWSGLRDWWSNTVQIFSDWENINSETLGNWWRDTKQGFSEWFTNTFSGLTTWWNDTKQRFTDWQTNTLSSYVKWFADTALRFEQWRESIKTTIILWAADALKPILNWIANTVNSIADWIVSMRDKFNQFKTDAIVVIIGFTKAALEAFLQWCRNVRDSVSEWFGGLVGDISKWWKSLWNTDKWSSGWSHVKGWFSDLLSDISNWFSNKKSSVKEWWSGLWDGLTTPSVTSTSPSGGRVSMAGHASGGIFNREHIARFAEGNKAEAIIPLENNSAMQPFVDAVSNGIVSSLAPVLVSGNSGNQLPPLYVGTLIADDRGLKELYRRFEVIQIQEDARKGIIR